jgi:hypothetical protein
MEGNDIHKLLLNETQKEKIDKSLKLKKGLELELDYEQIRINHPSGFLSSIFSRIGALGTLLGGGVVIANSVTDAKHKHKEIKRPNKEMDKIVKKVTKFKNWIQF